MHCVRETRENNELRKECDTEEERGSLMGWRRVPDKLHSLIPFVCVNGCDCVTFAGSNPTPSFLLIMQGLIKIQGDTCHQQLFNNKWGPCNFVNLSSVQSWYFGRAKINRVRRGESPLSSAGCNKTAVFITQGLEI